MMRKAHHAAPSGRTSRLRWAGLLVVALAACGGGASPGDVAGVDPDGQDSGIDFDALSAWRNFLDASRTWTVSGVATDGNPYTVTITTTAAAPATFAPTGAAVSASDTTLTIEGGGAVRTVVRTTFFDPATLQVVGLAWQGDAPTDVCDIPIETGLPPTAGRIPSSGLLAQATRSADCAPGTLPVASSVLFTWSLDRVGGVNLFCLNRHLLDEADPPRQHCAEIAADGTLGDRAFVSLEFDDGTTLEAGSP